MTNIPKRLVYNGIIWTTRQQIDNKDMYELKAEGVGDMRLYLLHDTIVKILNEQDQSQLTTS